MTPATAFSDLLQIHLVVPFGSLTTHPFCTPLFSPTTSLISPPSPSSSEETVSLGATNPAFNPPFPLPPTKGLTSNPICTAKFLGVNVTTASSPNNVLPPVENPNT